jgi:ribosome-associated toxin RatA of RatAB toxin-antitoxin module
MKHVKKSVLLCYSAREMYELVTDVGRYPEFLPWCERAELFEVHAGGVTARLSLAYAGVRHAFTTRNLNETDRSVSIKLVDGPFSQLDGFWQFLPLGKSATAETGACKIEFELSYAFSNRALEAVISPVFDRIASTFVESFVKRAESVHGLR